MKPVIWTLAIIILFTCRLEAQWEVAGRIDTINNDYYIFYKLYMTGKDVGFAVAGESSCHSSNGAIYKTADRGESWEVLHLFTIGEGYPYLLQFTNDTTGYVLTAAPAGYWDSDLYRTEDAGESWIRDSVSQISDFDIIDLTFVDEDHAWATVENSGVWRTVNGGQDWQRFFSANPYGNSCSEYSRLSFIDARTGFVLIRDYCDDFYYITRTTNGGGTWKSFEIYVEYLPDPHKMAFISKDAGFIAGGFSNQDEFYPLLLNTVDGGESWNPITDLNYLIHDLLFFNSDTIWIAGEDESGRGVILETMDAGASWHVMIDTIESPVRNLFFRDSTCWALCRHGLLLKNEEIDFVPVGGEQFIDDRQNILKLYPNPFTDELMVEIPTDISGLIRLEVFTATGRLAYTTIPDMQLKTLDLSFLSRGVYYISIRSKDFIASKKIIKLE